MSQKKPILFYSNYCQYCSEILNKLQKLNATDNFNILNISSGKFKIPSIVTSVPCIYINNKLLKDNDLESFIENNFNKRDEDVDAFFPSEMNSGIGYSYSYIGSDTNDEGQNIKNNLMYINDDSKIITPDEDSFSGNNSGSGNNDYEKMQAQNSQLQQFQQQRDNDLNKILNSGSGKTMEERNFIR
jgi:hypothetical protein